MHFLPYYWYSQNKDCDNLVKLDPDLLFAQPSVSYSALFEKLVADAIEADVVYSSVEKDCMAGIESANAVVNLSRYMALLNEFDHATESKFYVDGMFNRFLLSSPINLRLMPSTSVDLTLCLTDTTVSWTAPTHDNPHAFLRLSMGDDTLYSTVVLAADSASSVKVF